MSATFIPLIFVGLAIFAGCLVAWMLRTDAVIVQGQLYRRETHPIGFWGAVVSMSVSCLVNLGVAVWIAQLMWMEERGIR